LYADTDPAAQINADPDPKPCHSETNEKITLLSVYFLVFYESKKYLKGTLFSSKMQYLNKQGQQASSKILKHPDEVITR
jgi:hypothetical protein